MAESSCYGFSSHEDVAKLLMANPNSMNTIGYALPVNIDLYDGIEVTDIENNGIVKVNVTGIFKGKEYTYSCRLKIESEPGDLRVLDYALLKY